MEEGKSQVTSKEELFSKAVRAGKRTYFFDVKTTRGNDLYLTVTESKKRFREDGTHFYEKHKLFLYKEDFEKFIDGLNDSLEKITELRATGDYKEDYVPSDDDKNNNTPKSNDSFTNVDFDDLG